MKGLTRDAFSEHFYPTILVHGTQRWQLRLLSPPQWLSGSLYDAMKGSNGIISASRRDFDKAIWDLIEATHARDRKAKLRRPDAREFTGALYDALSEAGIEVSLGPPLLPHGGGYGVNLKKA